MPPGTDLRIAWLCTATNRKLVNFLFWTATETNHASKSSNFHKKLIDTITTSNFYLKFKENDENDMVAQVFWAVFYSSQRPSQIGSTTDSNGATTPPPIFSMILTILWQVMSIRGSRLCPPYTQLSPTTFLTFQRPCKYILTYL